MKMSKMPGFKRGMAGATGPEAGALPMAGMAGKKRKKRGSSKAKMMAKKIF